jgi:nicotinate phosphoribosyltransferase
MGQAIFNQFPKARARYKLIVRDKTRVFRPTFADELREQVGWMDELRMTPKERNGLGQKAPYLKGTYLDALMGFRFDSRDTEIRVEGDQVSAVIENDWYKGTLREVKYMATISELFFKRSEPENGYRRNIASKGARMQEAGVSWIDFGTRRRFSYGVQDDVNAIMQAYTPNFRGTSNPHFALKYNLPVSGTYAHEPVMAMQAHSGMRQCNLAWMDAWVREYRGNLGIALSDTVTTPAFLKDFDSYYAKLFDGVRLDSGNPFVMGDIVVEHYEKLGIDPKSKVLVFSDSLDTDKAIALAQHFAGSHQRSPAASGHTSRTTSGTRR